jgi:Glycosyltransferase family 87
LPAADYAAITFDLATMAGLFFLGRRLRPGPEGTRLGLVLAWVWAACPFTVLSLIVHTNDALIWMLSVFCLLLISSPAGRGAMLGLAAAAKFSPAALLPLLAAPRKGRRGALVCVVAFCAVVAASIILYLPPGGIAEFWHRTLGYQFTRADVFSPWALHPTLHPIQTVLEVVAVLFALGVTLFPRERSLGQVCALAGAVTIAIQLPATHWFYYYIMWFLPFALVGFLVVPALARQPADEPVEVERLGADRARGEPAMAGA